MAATLCLHHRAEQAADTPSSASPSRCVPVNGLPGTPSHSPSTTILRYAWTGSTKVRLIGVEHFVLLHSLIEAAEQENELFTGMRAAD